MSFVLDTDICSAYLKGDTGVYNRFVQYAGGLRISVVTAAELSTWAHRAKTPSVRRDNILEFVAEVGQLPLDEDVCDTFGRVRAAQLDRGVVVDVPDLLIACTALVHDFTLVTHNVKHYEKVSGLRIQDWLK